MSASPIPGRAATAATIGKNNEVRAVLATHGDNGTAARSVTHFLYPEFLPDTKKVRITTRLQQLGFAISPNGDHGILIEEQREVASADFDDFTEALERMLKDEGWSYDGWECDVVGADN